MRVAQPAHRPQVARTAAAASPRRPARAARPRPRRSRPRASASTCSSAADVAGRHAVRVEQQRPVHRVEQVDPADRDRADRVAVVGVLEAHEARARRLRLRRLLPVLERHLERDLDRGRAAVGVEHAASAARRARARARGDRDEPLRQLLGARMGEAEHRRVRDPVELRRAPRRRCAGGGGRARCTTATRRRRCSGARRCRRATRPRPTRSTGAGSASKPRICVNGCQRCGTARCRGGVGGGTSRDGSLGDRSELPGSGRPHEAAFPPAISHRSACSSSWWERPPWAPRSPPRG